MNPQCGSGRCENPQPLTFLHFLASYRFTIFPFRWKKKVWTFPTVSHSSNCKDGNPFQKKLPRRSAPSKMPYIRAFTHFIKPSQQTSVCKPRVSFPGTTRDWNILGNSKRCWIIYRRYMVSSRPLYRRGTTVNQLGPQRTRIETSW